MISKTEKLNDNSALALVQRFYTTIDAQQWNKQETFASGDFIAILGSSIRISFEAWQERLKAFYTAFPDGQHLLDFYNVEGDRILTVGRFTGTHQSEFMGKLPSGAQIEMGVMHLDRIVNNKIVEHTAAADLLGLSHQITLKDS
jgi:predicted ester cyclase